MDENKKALLTANDTHNHTMLTSTQSESGQPGTENDLKLFPEELRDKILSLRSNLEWKRMLMLIVTIAVASVFIFGVPTIFGIIVT